MHLLVTGICGFAGRTLTESLLASREGLEISGIDNFIRPGSEENRGALKALGVRLQHGDIRQASDLETLEHADWVIDAAANPSVLAGVDGRTSSRQLVEHNLGGTVNILEFCKANRAGFILLSTSRVYAISPLANLPVIVENHAFRPDASRPLPPHLSASGVTESFSTSPPVSLYGATKIASEALALEYGETFDFPVWINRCGVLAGAGQFGRPDQGIFSYWINAHLRRRPLKYIGFDGEGHQVRDCLHPRDIASLVLRQFDFQPRTGENPPRIVNVSGGSASARSLHQLTAWCDDRFGSHTVSADPQPRRFDIPWMVLDPALAAKTWNWQPATGMDAILEEIADHAERHPDWLDRSAPL